MKIIGLTGGSGAGKGETSAILQKYGIPSVDTDAVYHDLLVTSTALKNELVAAFGDTILDASGCVVRKQLAAAVFDGKDSSARLHTLNAITHKYIMAKTHELVKEFEHAGARAAVIDAPQLFEAGIEGECDIILGVLADRSLRLARIIERDGISRVAAEKRLAAQHDDAFYRANCDYILENIADTAALEQEIRRFLEESGLGL